MTSRAPRRFGFTLIELLVVIAIIALLLSLLMPSLSRVKQIARNMQCMSNLKMVGAACLGFASEHDGRFPGKGRDRVCPHWSATVHDILNREWWHKNERDIYPTGDWQDTAARYGPMIRWWHFTQMDQGLIKKRIICPSVRPWGLTNQWHRPYRFNIYAEGGLDWDVAGYPWQGDFGKEIPDPWRIHPNYDRYAYGARMDSFRNPSYQFLWCESEYANDDIFSSGTGSGVVLLGWPTSTPQPPWSGGSYGGKFGFRHLLARDQSLYQQQARANFGFIDGHVANIGPNDRVERKDRFVPN